MDAIVFSISRALFATSIRPGLVLDVEHAPFLLELLVKVIVYYSPIVLLIIPMLAFCMLLISLNLSGSVLLMPPF